MKHEEEFSIGQLAERTGLAVSAIRFYEDRGLVRSTRNSGGHRRFVRSDIRRLSFVLICQRLGFTLVEIREELDRLPARRTPTKRDWSRMAHSFRRRLDERIGELTRLRDRLDGCIGCGCLSLKNCHIYNPGDEIAEEGPGPRFVLPSESGV